MIWADVGRAALLGTIPLAAIGGWLTLAAGARRGRARRRPHDVLRRRRPRLPADDRATVGPRPGERRARRDQLGGGVHRRSASPGSSSTLLTAPIAIAVDAVSFVVSAVLLGSIRRPEPPPPPAADREPVLAEIREGLRLVVPRPGPPRAASADPWAWPRCGASSARRGCCSSTEDLRLDPAVIGVIAALGGFGSLLGALLAERAAARFGDRAGRGGVDAGRRPSATC